ncbi:MAG: hypothetical protein P8177_03150 [Gemmatimonadota bacterium]|jgi:Spy/CpxP family protein refolding chaperone
MMSLLERSRLLGFGLLVVTFLAGAISGAALERVAGPGQPAAAERGDAGGDGDGRRYIIDRVDMGPAQRAAIEAVMKERSERMRAVWREVEPRMDAITDSARAEIMGILTPEQRAQYEAKLKERRSRWDRRDREDDRHGPASDDPTPDPTPTDPAADPPAGDPAAEGAGG